LSVVLIMLLKTSSESLCQTIDTTCVPTIQLRKVVADAKLRPVLEERIAILNERISTKDSVIKDLQLAGEEDQAVIEALRDQRRLLEEEKKLYNDQLRTLESMIRKEKRKRFFTSMAGMITTAGAMYLFISK
jgi:uncharacterized coiled-coil protein SlyX